MTSASDVVVVELTNPTEGQLAITMILGGDSRTIATLAPGRSILLVSPPGASWEFTEVAASSGAPRAAAPSDAEQTDLPPGDDGDRGRGSPQ